MTTSFDAAKHPRRPDGRFDHTAGGAAEAGEVELALNDDSAREFVAGQTLTAEHLELLPVGAVARIEPGGQVLDVSKHADGTWWGPKSTHYTDESLVKTPRARIIKPNLPLSPEQYDDEVRTNNERYARIVGQAAHERFLQMMINRPELRTDADVRRYGREVAKQGFYAIALPRDEEGFPTAEDSMYVFECVEERDAWEQEELDSFFEPGALKVTDEHPEGRYEGVQYFEPTPVDEGPDLFGNRSTKTARKKYA